MEAKNLDSKLASICNIQNLEDKLQPTELFGFGIIYGDQFGLEDLSESQKEQIESILKTDVGFREVRWVDSPIFKTDNGLVHQVSTHRAFTASDYSYFKGKVCYLYKISFTPVLWETSTLWKSGNPNGSYVPKFYDNTDSSDDCYQPTRILTVRWNPEEVDEDNELEFVTSTVKNILNNKEEYLPGKRQLVIRMKVVE